MKGQVVMTIPRGSGGSNGGSEPFIDIRNVPQTLGGITSGMNFPPPGVKTNELLRTMLYPYQSPSFSAFAIQGQTATIEVGATVPANRVFTWTATQTGNIVPNSVTIRNQTAGVDIATGLAITASPYTSTSAPVTRNTAGNNVWRISGQNTQSGTFTRDYTVTWQFLRYFGKSTVDPLTETGIKALPNSALAANSSGTYNFPAGSGYCYIVGTTALTSFSDQATGFNIPFAPSYTVNVTNQYNVAQTYYVHRSTNIMNGAITIVAN